MAGSKPGQALPVNQEAVEALLGRSGPNALQPDSHLGLWDRTGPDTPGPGWERGPNWRTATAVCCLLFFV